jgi:hypothetical protein
LWKTRSLDDIVAGMDNAVSSLVSLWPVELGAIIWGCLFAYMLEPKPFLGRGQPSAFNFSR